MIGPVARVGGSSYANRMQENRAEPKLMDVHGSIADSVEELAMARSKFQEKDKGTVTRERARYMLKNPDLVDAVEEVLKGAEQKPTRESVMQALSRLKDDVSQYQLLKFLLESGDIDASLYQFINEEIDKLRRKRRKIVSLDNISAETEEFTSAESVNGTKLQNMYLNFLEFDGQMCLYFESLFKSSKKYKKLAKFMSKMINYEIYGLTPNDDIELYAHMNERRKSLNLLADIYDHLEHSDLKGQWFLDRQTEKNETSQHKNNQQEQQNQDQEEEKENEEGVDYDKDILFITSFLMNMDVDEICSKMSTKTVAYLIEYLNKVHVDLFYSPEDKEEVLDTMKSNISHRFIRHGIR